LHCAVLQKVNAQAKDAAVLLLKAIQFVECMALVVAQRLKKALPGLPWQTPHTGEKPELFD
jgi:Glu-tRNA(Gln) amidotransferase subunit E-like FAD-binding protein